MLLPISRPQQFATTTVCKPWSRGTELATRSSNMATNDDGDTHRRDVNRYQRYCENFMENENCDEGA